jgi:serine/threonine protein kinase
MDQRIGTQIAGPGQERFRIEARVGNGSFGEVYRALGVDSRTVVAVKMVPKDKLLDPTTLSIKTVLNEGRVAMLHVKHPNVVSVLHVDSGSDVSVGPYVMMEYIDGENLQGLINQRQQEGRQLSLDEALSLMRGVAFGAQAINEYLVHRDIKPDNILIDRRSGESIPRIADFGIAKIASDRTRPETFKGIQAIWYMAPEVWRQERNTFKIDVYSVGLVFYQVLTLTHPLLRSVDDPSDWIQWRETHLTVPCPDVRGVRADVPLSLAKLMLAMTDKSPGNRPSWEEVVAGLNQQTASSGRAVDPQLIAAMKNLADERFRVQQKKTEEELRRERETERLQAREEEFRQSSRRLLTQFEEIIETLNQQDGIDLIRISGDGILSREFVLPTGRRLTCNTFGLNLKMERPVLGGGYFGIDGGLSANLLLMGQPDDIASGSWSAVEVTVMAIIGGDARLKWYREARLSDATIRFVEFLDGNEPWRRDSGSFFGFRNADLFYEHYTRVNRAMHVYSFSLRPDVLGMFSEILRLGLRMPAP